jgi:hypothetical protein
MRVLGVALAAALLVGFEQSDGVAQERNQGQRRNNPPLTPAEVERRINEEVTRQLRQRMQLPDSQLDRLTQVNIRFRDSLRFLEGRERFIRNELNRAARPEPDSGGVRRQVDQERIACLMDAFWTVNQHRLDARRGEHREVSAFLTPVQRFRYMSIQENLREVIDNFFERLNDRGGGRRGGAMGPPPDSGMRGGPPVGGRAGRAGGPPPGGRLGGPPGRNPANLAICPPR